MSSARCPYLPLFCKLVFLRANALATCIAMHSRAYQSLHPISHARDTRTSGAATKATAAVQRTLRALRGAAFRPVRGAACTKCALRPTTTVLCARRSGAGSPGALWYTACLISLCFCGTAILRSHSLLYVALPRHIFVQPTLAWQEQTRKLALRAAYCSVCGFTMIAPLGSGWPARASKMRRGTNFTPEHTTRILIPGLAVARLFLRHQQRRTHRS